MLMNAHVIEWMFWEFKKDKQWYYFPMKSGAQHELYSTKSP